MEISAAVRAELVELANEQRADGAYGAWCEVSRLGFEAIAGSQHRQDVLQYEYYVH